MKYKIGDVSRAFCISKNTLRYYQEKGIILPAHRDGSDYRYYGNEQMHQIGSLKKLRNLGFSVEEIREFFEGVSLDRLQEIMDDLVQKKERELQLQQYLADQLRDLDQRVRDRAQPARTQHTMLPERYELNLTSIENLVEDRELQKVAPEWFNNAFPVKNIHILSLDGVRRGEVSPLFGLTVDSVGARLLDLPISGPYVLHRDSQPCLCLSLRLELNSSLPAYLAYCQQLLACCDERALTPCGDFCFNIALVYALPDGRTAVMGDLCLPVLEHPAP